MKMIKRFQNSIVFLLCIFLLFGCATTTKQKPDLKDKSDKLFQELGKEENPNIEKKDEMKQLEDDINKKQKINDKNLKEQNKQKINIKQEEIDFEEIGEGMASKYERTIDAERRAEEDALSKALKKTGQNVYYGFSDALAQYGDKQQQFVSRYQFTWTNSLTKWERVNKPEFITMETGETKCVIKIKGKIFSRGESEPGYEIRIDTKENNLGLNKPIYSSGNEIKLNFSVTRDSYITILNIDEEQNVYLVYPNKFVKTGIVKAGEIFSIPGDLGINVKAILPKDKKETIELLHIIATKKYPLFSSEDSGEITIGEHNVFSVGEFKKVAERLAKLNRDEWTMMVLPYTIRSK